MNGMREENESIGIYQQLVRDGYLVRGEGNTFIITEPTKRYMPQEARGVRSMREALKWAEGCESIRFVAEHYKGGQKE